VQVRLTVMPARIETLDPLDALVSVVVPNAAAACCDVRGVFCQHVFFFAGLTPTLWGVPHIPRPRCCPWRTPTPWPISSRGRAIE